MRILVADDELVSRSKLQAILNKFGHCDAVEDGGDAIDSFRAAWEQMTPYDLVCLDIHMPEVSGTEALKIIRDDEERMGLGPGARVKAVMVTSDADHFTVTRAMESGCDEYIVKPINPARVNDKIMKLFPRRY